MAPIILTEGISKLAKLQLIFIAVLQLVFKNYDVNNRISKPSQLPDSYCYNGLTEGISEASAKSLQQLIVN